MTVELAFYPYDRVQSVSSLCRALGETEARLQRIIENIPSLYIGPTKKPKKNGSGFRDVYDMRLSMNLDATVSSGQAGFSRLL
jgi:hypothetical protein